MGFRHRSVAGGDKPFVSFVTFCKDFFVFSSAQAELTICSWEDQAGYPV